MQLMEHQNQVLEKSQGKNKVGYFLDMGLGKTFVASEKMRQLNNKLTIIICPKSVLKQWVEHIKTHYKNYEVYVNTIKNNTRDSTVLIFNYDMVWRKQELLKYKDYTLILDESQFIKNYTAKRTKFILKMQFEKLILLSGTPTRWKI